ncbi:MAG: hypothetical protein ACXWU6_06710 [Allosphingosinicella sp.]
MVIDIRTVSRSRTHPQYKEDSIGEALAGCQIGHGRIPALGNLRSPGLHPAGERPDRPAGLVYNQRGQRGRKRPEPPSTSSRAGSIPRDEGEPSTPQNGKDARIATIAVAKVIRLRGRPTRTKSM